jgi:hypothetical protein
MFVKLAPYAGQGTAISLIVLVRLRKGTKRIWAFHKESRRPARLVQPARLAINVKAVLAHALDAVQITSLRQTHVLARFRVAQL